MKQSVTLVQDERSPTAVHVHEKQFVTVMEEEQSPIADERELEEGVGIFIPGMAIRPRRCRPTILKTRRHQWEDDDNSETSSSVDSRTYSGYNPNLTTDSDDSVEMPNLNYQKLLSNDASTTDQFHIDEDFLVNCIQREYPKSIIHY